MTDAKLHDEPIHTAHLRGLRAVVHQLFSALIKLALVKDAPDSAIWRTDALEAQRQIATEPTGFAEIHLDSLWALAIKTAESDPVVRSSETVNPMLPTMLPLGPQHMTDPVELDKAVQIIRDAASFG